MFKRLSILSCVAATIAIALVGCASFDEHINTERLLVQVGVMKIIEKGDNFAEQSARAERIIAFTSDARTWLNTEQVGYDQLRTSLVNRLADMDLAPSDRILATLVIDSVMASLKERVIDGIKLPVPPEQFKYQVNTVLDWAEEFAQSYVN